MMVYFAGSPPPEVDIEIGVGAQETSKADEKEKEALEEVDGVFDPQPPVGILKKGGYVSGSEEEAAIPPKESKHGKRKAAREKRKLVPVWRLVSSSSTYLTL